ncbi:glycosyltransferase [candidate division KSB1 bacterium]|nr:glycosyltransferase [candidate division KSB1 bacterium]
MIIFITVLLLLSFFYLTCIFWLRWGLGRLNPGSSSATSTVSVVVAARNEARNIAGCLSALERQSYQKDKLEIIIVDDRSDDATAVVVRRRAENNPQIQLIQITDLVQNIAPKKNALDSGIRSASGEIILVTDADCLPGDNWVQGMVACFDEGVGLVAGFSPLENNGSGSILQRLVALDSLSLACVAAGSIGAGTPLTCNGRNLAYRKRVYEQVGGFSKIGHLVSGDDDLFLHQVRDFTDWKVAYSIAPETTVPTAPPSGLAAFSNQRTRHASKGKHYALPMKTGLALVYLFNCLLFFGLPVCALVSTTCLVALSGCFAAKAVSEFALLYKGTSLFKRTKLLSAFPLAMLFHIPYVVIFGALGAFGKFSWKGESFQAQMS